MTKEPRLTLVPMTVCCAHEDKYPEDAIDWLLSLPGPMVIDQAGQDPSRWRVICTLIHGNEPSGFYAIHRWLLSQQVPVCNVRFILCAVEAARKVPYFNCRFVDNDADLNRCFNAPAENPQVTQRANEIADAIQEVRPEAVIDMHNTSGASPAFAVATQKGLNQQALASFFCDSLFFTRLQLGSLMEQDFACPIVTIECGGSQQQISHQLAFQGISEYLQAESLFSGRHFELSQVLEHPLRVEIAENIVLSYGGEADPKAKLTLVSDIEQHNTGITRAHSLLGWSLFGCNAFKIKNEAGQVIDSDILYAEDGAIYTRYPMRIFMATSNPRIALHDCLMYAFIQTV
ncbi:succinylglutamate desuccinylase/aspartoacylase domain-containing protein [Gayadomonas joobiniege]|uniref:succinylglutamate desuccinylase/aspartoacylase domain-containing protein n=1 Tax=Gayadomonas joobiniege TaxID=1234606 RepID=UPI000374CD41|nr:succinylglutamate desuccinylase/aspartoacylase family protein [Gayadomonas joobiniege]